MWKKYSEAVKTNMKIEKFEVGSLGVNCYILEKNGKCALIDPGDNYEQIKTILLRRQVVCVVVLLTHAHFDHAGCVKKLQDDGAKVYLHKDDLILLNTPYNLAEAFGTSFESFAPDHLLVDGEKIDILGEKLTVIHTPGHTGGSVCFAYNETLFSGDTLFYLSVGRTDFPTGNSRVLKASLEKLLNMEKNMTVCPGHGEFTDLFFERKYNPYA